MNNKIKNMQPLLLICLLILTASILNGCISNNAVSSNYYVLNPDAQLQPLDDSIDDRISVEVLSLDIPPYLDRKQIVTRSSAEQLEFSESHRWGGKLHKNLERIFTRNLSLLLDSDNIWIRPRALAIEPDYKIQIKILSFEYDGQQQVNLAAQWQLKNNSTDRIVAANISEISRQPALTNDDSQRYRNITVAMSQSFAELSTLIARQILADAKP